MGALEFGIAFAKRFDFPDNLNNTTLVQQGLYYFVEPAGFEPASKHMPDKLSTCLSRNLISGSSQNRANLLLPYTA